MPLEGIVEMDETWIGGKRQERPGFEPWVSKAMVMDAVERGGEVRLMLQAQPDRKTRAAYRDNAFLFRDTLLRMMQCETLPYAELVAEDEAA